VKEEFFEYLLSELLALMRISFLLEAIFWYCRANVLHTLSVGAV